MAVALAFMFVPSEWTLHESRATTTAPNGRTATHDIRHALKEANAPCETDSVSPAAKMKKEQEDPATLINPERTPQFPGGYDALKRYVEAHAKYPATWDYSICVQGRVIIQFVVEADGSVTHPKVMRSLHPELDKVALQMVESMPKWIPGGMWVNGKIKPLPMKYTIPVTFRTKEGSAPKPKK
ncbi:MAG: energy transducer TonB [Mediterranea sp.]|nr:energy transducer TonB [Mediterranea sp.]